MILIDKVYVNITNRNRSYYKKMGYDVSDNSILINVSDLTSNSNVEILISCDVCEVPLVVAYYNYNKYKLNMDIYTCKDCSHKHKTKLTNLKKYGSTTPLGNKEILEKLKKTNIDRYGCICSLQCNEVKNKTIKTSIERYGVEIPCTSQKAKENQKITNLKKYGKENIFQTEYFKEKMIKKKIDSGFCIENLNEWKIYKNKVRRITYKFKKKLFENWNGYDYYDDEYIKDNINLHYNNRLYPTIDHKISTFYGFINDISADIIGNIENLAITKKFINSSKNLKLFY